MSCIGAAQQRAAPFPDVAPQNQLEVFANSCGPVCLYNSLTFGSRRWEKLLRKIPKESAKERMLYLVRTLGQKPSRHFSGIKRWSARSGMRSADLLDLANDLRGSSFLPKLELTHHFQAPKKPNTVLLAQAHREMQHSLKKGFPPIATLQRYAQKGSMWLVIQGHFVSIIEVPSELPRGATSFPVRYIDPWGGKILTGTIRAPEAVYPVAPTGGALFDLATGPAAIIADFPETQVGKKKLKKGQTSRLHLTELISVK